MKRNKETKKKKVSSIKKLLIAVIIILLVALGYVIYLNFFDNKSDGTAPKVVDEIKTFNYVVNEKDTKLFKSTFKELKEVLSKKEVDNEKYAKVVAKLFIIDFFSLENKSSKNDVGGVQFVYSSYKTDFIDGARNSIYKQVTNNIDSGKKQALPLVDNVEVKEVEKVVPSNIFESEKVSSLTEENGFEISVSWSYKNSDDFQTNAILTIIPDGNKLSVAKMSEE